jgi:hypothetical protein
MGYAPARFWLAACAAAAMPLLSACSDSNTLAITPPPPPEPDPSASSRRQYCPAPPIRSAVAPRALPSVRRTASTTAPSW